MPFTTPRQIPPESPDEIRYQNYVAFCKKFSIKPAEFETWLKTLAKIADTNYS